MEKKNSIRRIKGIKTSNGYLLSVYYVLGTVACLCLIMFPSVTLETSMVAHVGERREEESICFRESADGRFESAHM